MNTLTDNGMQFLNIYREELERDYPAANIPLVMERMAGAIAQNNFNKDSRAFRVACKRLKIKHTYRDIQMFIHSEKGL